VHNITGYFCDVEEFPLRIHWRDRRPLDELHYEVVRPDIVKLADIRMIERRHRPRFTLKTFRKSFFAQLEGNGAVQARVASLAHLSMPPAPIGLRISYGPRPVPDARDIGLECYFNRRTDWFGTISLSPTAVWNQLLWWRSIPLIRQRLLRFRCAVGRA